MLPVPMRGFHRAVSASDEARCLGGTSRVNRAPIPQRDGADERWLLDRDSHQDDGRGGGQSVEWSFGAVSQSWLVRFLEHRVGDKRIIRLIQKWLRSGILEDGIVTVDDRGTGQGSVISPLLANIYLRYCFDLWAERWRRQEARGDMIVVRYADDLVVGFEHEDDARRFLDAMRTRLEAFALSLHPEKTRLIEFGRFAAQNREKRGLG